MTETLPPPPPPGGTSAVPRRLVRRPDEKVLAGVCASFARATDTDPLLWRVGIAVLTLFGGTGIALYLLGWLLVPQVGQGPTAVERALRRPDKNVGTLVLLGLGAVVLLSAFDDGPPVGALLLFGGVFYLVYRSRHGGSSEPATAAYAPPLVMHGPDPAPAWDPTAADGVTSTRVTPEPYDSGLTAPAAFGANYGGAYGAGPSAGTYDTSPFAAWDAVPPPAPKGRRRRSRLGLLTLSAAAVVAGALLTLRSAGFEQFTVARILAVVLVVLGAGILVGTWVGRARWLLLPALVVAAALVPAALFQSAPGYDGGVGSRSWTPLSTDLRTQYELGAGEAELDLRQLDPQALPERLSVELGLGELVVLVPDGVRVRVTADLAVGEILTGELGGDLRSLQEGPSDRDRTFTVGAAGDPLMELDLEVGAGVIEVRRVAS